MHPVLFNLWKYPVYSWGLSLAVAFVVGTVYAAITGKKRGIDPDNVIDLALFVCIASIVGARLLYVLLNIRSYIDYPVSVFYMRDGGLSYFGGLGAGIGVGVLYCLRQKISIGKMADLAAPAVAIGYAIARVGCLLNGCCYGHISEVPWALAAGPGDILRHPTQLYAAILSVIIFFLLRVAEPKKKFVGQILWLYVGLYSVARFVVEFWRVGTRDYFAPFTSTQILCVLLAVFAFGVIRVKTRAAAPIRPDMPGAAGPSARA
ncbi:MAG: prolipoprotein diacylglyceryl transferase [Firmicutes bacterium]|nr:prolipoprotein diacylglyceryl transferase [Bacillota bacterium]